MTQITKREIFIYKSLTNTLQNNNNSHLTPTYDLVLQETPVAFVYNGIAHTVMMATPHQLEDFAYGFSLAEGIIQSPKEIYGIDIIETCQGIELQIELATRAFVALKDHRRTMAGRTGCGICGTEKLAQLKKNISPLAKTLTFSLEKLPACLETFQSQQKLRQETGASHAAAFFSPEGNLLAIREDIGRHIALDKLLGWHARVNNPQGFVLVSSRASFEMVQKTATCGIEMLIAMSATTELAIQLAEETHLTLIGFARPNRANIYTVPTRCK